MMRPLVLAAAILGFLWGAALILANVAASAGTTPGSAAANFFVPMSEDTVLHDTYYVVASAGRLAMAAQLALLHLLAALFCATQAPALRGGLLAGWIFVAGASIGFAAQVGSLVSMWIVTPNMPERIVDYDPGLQFAQLAAAQNVLALISLVGFLVMLAGWPLLAIAAVRRAKQPSSITPPA